MATKKELKKRLKKIRRDAMDSIEMSGSVAGEGPEWNRGYWEGIKIQAEITLSILDEKW